MVALVEPGLVALQSSRENIFREDCLRDRRRFALATAGLYDGGLHLDLVSSRFLHRFDPKALRFALVAHARHDHVDLGRGLELRWFGLDVPKGFLTAGTLLRDPGSGCGFCSACGRFKGAL